MAPTSRPKGSYLLLLCLEQGTEIEVGSLGPCDFPPGIYGYAGSAQTSLHARVGRHFSEQKRLHWHIDRLLRHAHPFSAILIEGGDMECEINQVVAGASGSRMVCAGFGSSDCDCATHLHIIDEASLPSIVNELRWLSDS